MFSHFFILFMCRYELPTHALEDPKSLVASTLQKTSFLRSPGASMRVMVFLDEGTLSVLNFQTSPLTIKTSNRSQIALLSTYSNSIVNIIWLHGT